MELRYFNLSDFDCQETGKNKMDKDFLLKLDELRHICGFAFIITSGYRSPEHSIEAKKTKPGKHSEGIAADIKCVNSKDRYTLIKNAVALGFKGIGIHKTFIHVDTREGETLWLY